MTDPLSLVDPAWRNIEFDHEQVVPGEAFPNLDGMTLAVDVETRPTVHIKKAGLSAFHADVLGVSVGCPELRRCWYVPLRHRAPGAERFNVDPGATMRWLADILPRAKLLLNQNLKFDAKFLDREGVRAQSYDHVPLYDTQVGSVLIDERESSALKPTALRVLGMPPDEQKVIEQYIVGSQDFQDWSYVPADLMAPYGCGDVERAIRLAGAQRSALDEIHALVPTKRGAHLALSLEPGRLWEMFSGIGFGLAGFSRCWLQGPCNLGRAERHPLSVERHSGRDRHLLRSSGLARLKA